jgi:hypothetical protein
LIQIDNIPDRKPPEARTLERFATKWKPLLLHLRARAGEARQRERNLSTFESRSGRRETTQAGAPLLLGEAQKTAQLRPGNGQQSHPELLKNVLQLTQTR